MDKKTFWLSVICFILLGCSTVTQTSYEDNEQWILTYTKQIGETTYNVYEKRINENQVRVLYFCIEGKNGWIASRGEVPKIIRNRQ